MEAVANFDASFQELMDELDEELVRRHSFEFEITCVAFGI
jgi:hypothetical protein